MNIIGSGIFSFSKELILTRQGQDKRSIWELESFFHPRHGAELSYHPSKRWKLEDGKAVLQSAYPGQEFVVKCDPNRRIEKWGTDIVLKYGTRI